MRPLAYILPLLPGTTGQVPADAQEARNVLLSPEQGGVLGMEGARISLNWGVRTWQL